MEGHENGQGHHLGGVAAVENLLRVHNGVQVLDLVALPGNDLIAMTELILEPAPLLGTIFAP